MIEIPQSTSTVVRIGPFRDVTDDATPETGITLGTADEAEVLKAGGGASVDISGNTWAAVSGSPGWYDLTLTASNTDTLGEFVVVVQDVSVCRPVYQRFMVVPASYSTARVNLTNFYANVSTGTAQAGAAATITLASGASASDNIFTGAVIFIYSGTGAKQTRVITAYVGSTKVATVSAWETQPDNTSKYIIIPAFSGGLTTAAIADAVLDEVLSGHTTAGTLGKAIGDNVDAPISTVDTVVDAIAVTATANAAAIAALNNLSAANVNAEMVDVISTDTYAEPGQESPGATVSLATKIGYLYKFLRNRKTQTATTFKLYADDATTVDQKSTTADDGTTASTTEITTGP